MHLKQEDLSTPMHHEIQTEHKFTINYQLVLP